MWLLIWQRLQSGGCLESAVLELVGGLPASFWPRPCKRLRDLQEKKIPLSSNTGAYNQARQGLPLSVVQQSCDRMFNELTTQMEQRLSGVRRAFLLDGSSMRMADSPTLRKSYPPGSNQHGKAHWPLLRILVAHDLHTGLAMRPEWGPMNGRKAVSEQGLLEKAIDRIPKGARLVCDANFGVFSVAYVGDQKGYPLLLRLTTQRARRLAGEVLQDGIERTIVWKPSRQDRRSHPKLPADACVTGRLLVRKVQPSNGDKPFLLPLFVTGLATTEESFDLYGHRWDIETDLRTLKATLRLDQLTCTTPEMIAKEIDLGIAAYNLVRAVTVLAAEQSGVPPRGYSFTKIKRLVEIYSPKLAAAKDEREREQIFEQFMYYVQQAKLPRRKRPRPSYPRAVWPKRKAFPNRKN